MDVKTDAGVMISVDAVKKPQNATKVEELAAMEEALKKATEEAHNQRLALSGGSESSSLTQTSTKAM